LAIHRSVKKSFRFTPDEWTIIEQKADAAGVKPSDFIRQSALKSKVKRSDKKEQLHLISQIAKIGNNLNQIARRCNTEKIIDRLTLEELYKIEQQLMELLNDR